MLSLEMKKVLPSYSLERIELVPVDPASSNERIGSLRKGWCLQATLRLDNFSAPLSQFGRSLSLPFPLQIASKCKITSEPVFTDGKCANFNQLKRQTCAETKHQLINYVLCAESWATDFWADFKSAFSPCNSIAWLILLLRIALQTDIFRWICRNTRNRNAISNHFHGMTFRRKFSRRFSFKRLFCVPTVWLGSAQLETEILEIRVMIVRTYLKIATFNFRAKSRATEKEKRTICLILC